MFDFRGEQVHRSVANRFDGEGNSSGSGGEKKVEGVEIAEWWKVPTVVVEGTGLNVCLLQWYYWGKFYEHTMVLIHHI